MNQHILANYSARLRTPENVEIIRAILRRVAATAGVKPREILYTPPPSRQVRISQLRGQVGFEMLANGFRKRDVAELFSQNFDTTNSQISRHAADLHAAGNYQATTARMDALRKAASSQ